MFPKKSIYCKQSNKGQKGSALVIAVFVIVVMSLLGLSLVRMLETSGNAVAYEVLGTRAFQTAQVGVQYQLRERFPLLPTAPTHCDGDTVTPTSEDSTVNLAVVNPGDVIPPAIDNVNGLLDCRVVALTCSDIRVNNEIYFTISATGECQSGDVITTRTVEVTAKTID